MDSSLAGFMAKVMRCITWLHYHIFRSQALARLRHTARVIVLGIWPLLYRRWKWSQQTASGSFYSANRAASSLRAPLLGWADLVWSQNLHSIFLGPLRCVRMFMKTCLSQNWMTTSMNFSRVLTALVYSPIGATRPLTRSG